MTLAGLVGAACLIGLFFMFAGESALPGVSPAKNLTLAAREMGLTAAEEETLSTAIQKHLGTWEKPKVPRELAKALGIKSNEELVRGSRTWRVKCLQCHGATGAANGPTAGMLIPTPRSFHEGVIKFTTTRAGAPPVREDLKRTIRQGIPFTSMASFGGLPESAIEELVSITAYILARGPIERQAAEGLSAEPFNDEEALALVKKASDNIAQSWLMAREAVVDPSPPFPEKSAQSVARGRELFLGEKVNCADCHGRNGAGKGPRVWDATNENYLLLDLWGKPVRPRDLRAGQFRGGAQPKDLFRRIDQGIKGTPMNGYNEVLSKEEIWDLVHFIQALAQP